MNRLKNFYLKTLSPILNYTSICLIVLFMIKLGLVLWILGFILGVGLTSALYEKRLKGISDKIKQAIEEAKTKTI